MSGSHRRAGQEKATRNENAVGRKKRRDAVTGMSGSGSLFLRRTSREHCAYIVEDGEVRQYPNKGSDEFRSSDGKGAFPLCCLPR